MTQDIASIGFSVDTSGIERGAVALDVLASKGAEVDKAVSQIEGATARAKKSLDTLGQSARDGAGLGDVGKSAAATASGMDAAGKAAERSAVGVKRSADMFGLFGGDVRKAADALGLYDSSTKKAIDHQKELAQILDRANPAAAAARKMADEVQTLNRALREGTIGQDAYRSAMRNVVDEANRASGSISNMGSAAGALHGIFAKLGGVFAAGFSAREFLATADAVTSLNNQLKLATGSADSAKTAYAALFEIAQRSRVSFVELGTTYASIARSTGEMGISQQRLLKVTESIGNAMTISGGSAQSMQAALVQLSQGFASGALRGDELNSVMEQTPRLAKAIADGLGVSIGKLREMGKEGQITAESVVKALESQSDALRTEVAGATLTVGQAFTQLGNASTRATGEFDAATGASATFASAISSVASAMDGLGASFRENETTINTVMGALGGTAAVASLRLLPAAIGAVGAAVTGLAAILAANPVTLALLGVGAVVGGAVSYARAEAKTAEGIQRSIDALRLENERSEAAMQRAAAGGRTAGADTIRKTIDERTAAIAKLREELGKLQSSSVAGAGAGRGTINPPTIAEMERQQSANSAARTKAINDLLGVSQKYQDKLTELQGLQKSGVLTSAEYVQAVSKLATETWAATDAGKAAAEASKAGTKARDEAAKATQREAEAYGSFLSSVQSKIAAIDLELAGGAKLTESQRLQLQLQKMIADGKVKESRAEQEATKALLAGLSAKEDALKLQTAQSKALEESAKAYDAYIKAQQNAVRADVEKNNTLRLEIEAMGLTKRELLALNRSRMDEQIVALQAKHSLLTLAGARDDETKVIREQIKALQDRKELLGQQFEKQEMLDAQQQITEMWTSIDSTAHDVFVNIFEDGAGTFKRLGQTLKSALLDMLYQLTVKRWIINIGASFGATGGIFAAGNAVAGQGGGATNLLGGLGNLFGGSAAGAGGFGGFMGLGSFGSGFGAGLGALFGEAGLMGGLSAGATAIGAGNILGGLGTLAGVAAPILGPLALLGLSGAFSRKHEQHNLQGTFGGASGFEGNWHDYYKGGLFRSSKTVDTPLEADFLKGLQDAWNAQEAAVTSYAQALGLATDSIAGFTYDVNIKLKDLDPKAGDYQQQLMARVADAIKAGSNEMAQQIIGSWDTVQETVTRHVQQFGDDGFSTVEETITRQTYVASEFAREGESAIDTLTRLGSSLQAVNSVFDTLGYTLLSASLASGDLASSIIDAFGGQERFGAQTGSYFQNYYSAAERRATLQRQLTDEMDRLGFVLPATRDGFRRLVEAQRLTTTEGQQTYAALIGLSGAFAEITQSSEEAAQALSDATDRAFAALSRYIGQQRELWQTALQAAQTLVAEARDIRDTASGAARELWGQSDDTRAMLAVQGRATIDRMLSGLRATGALPDADELRRAIKDARGGLDMSQYATVAEYELAQALLAGQLSEIGDLAGEQMTVAEKQVAAAEAQIKQLDQTLDFWREQLDAMRGDTLLFASIDEGVTLLADAVRKEQAAKDEAAKKPPSRGSFGGGGGGGDRAPIDYAAEGERLKAQDWWGDGNWYRLLGYQLEVAARALEVSPADLEEYLASLGMQVGSGIIMPRFAAGGLHSGGLRLVGERGPELEVTGPARYWSHEQTRSMFRGGGGDQTALLEELQALRAEIRELRAAAASGAKAAQDTHNLLDRVSAGGNALLVEAA